MNHRKTRRPLRVVAKLAYWLLVLFVSLVLLIALVMFFESRDESQVDERAGTALTGR